MTSKNGFNQANLENSKLVTTNDYQKRETSFLSTMVKIIIETREILSSDAKEFW